MTSRAVRGVVCLFLPVTFLAACNVLSGLADFQTVDEVDAGTGVIDSGPADVPEVSVPEASPDTGGPDLTPKRVFVTSKMYMGNLGGRSGADDKCQQAAIDATATIPDASSSTWIAWLSSNNKNAIDRITHEGPYQLLNGIEVVRNKAQLISGGLSHAIDRNEHNVAYTENRGVWTGTRKDGTMDATCNGWSDSTDAFFGTLGSALSKDDGWTKGAPQPGQTDNWHCDVAVALYCFEQ